MDKKKEHCYHSYSVFLFPLNIICNNLSNKTFVFAYCYATYLQ